MTNKGKWLKLGVTGLAFLAVVAALLGEAPKFFRLSALSVRASNDTTIELLTVT